MWEIYALIIGPIVALYLYIVYLYISKINVEEILLKADVKIVNHKDLARSYDIIIHNDKARDDFISGSLGFMESYMKGYWSCRDLEKLFQKLEEANLHQLSLYTIPQLISIGLNRLRVKIKGFTQKDGQLVGLQHYDLPRKLYETMLGSSMIYSCAYFKNVNSLHDAQRAKMELICQKIKLSPGMTVLDIGCGWGTLAYFLVVNYNVKVVAITISKEQIKYCQETFQHPNLTYKLEDYRNMNDQIFDRIVSVGMFEHVTSINYETYFKVCEKILKPKGLFLLHTITGDKSHQPGEGNPFIMKYIFPNSQLPSLSQITQFTSYKFVIEDVQNFGLYYAKTLKKWRNNFDDYLQKNTLDNSFIRMWKAYLIMSQIGFEKNRIFLHQLVLSKDQTEVYEAVR